MLLPTSIGRYQALVQNECLPAIHKGQRRQFAFGLSALAARPLVSLNSNARTAGLSRTAGESKMARLLKNAKLRNQLAGLHVKLSGVTPASIVNVDHSECNGLSVLLFAAQTHTGRALPVYLETMPSLAQGHNTTSRKYRAAKARYLAWKQQTGLDQYSSTIRCIGNLAQRLGFLPGLVFDRGFCNKRILKYLKRHKISGYVRARAWFRVIAADGTKQRIAAFAPGSYTVRFGCKLRLVVGQQRSGEEEPWYILTTDWVTSTEQILNIYYHRFEIEELFRDMKSLLQAKGAHLQKPGNLATLLWFICLGILLLVLCQPMPQAYTSRSQAHPKKKLSVIRVLFEHLEAELRSHLYAPWLARPG